MNNLNNYITEKLRISKNTKVYNEYTFKGENLNMIIRLPFTIIDTKNNEYVIDEIVALPKEASEPYKWEFYQTIKNKKYLFIRLSEMGVENLFNVRNMSPKINMFPKIYFDNKGKEVNETTTIIKLKDKNNVIIKK